MLSRRNTLCRLLQCGGKSRIDRGENLHSCEEIRISKYVEEYSGMKKKLSKVLLASVISASLLSQSVMAGTGFPDLGELFSEAAEGIADAAGKAGDTLSGAAGSAGDVFSGAVQKAEEVLSEAAEKAGETLNNAIDTVKGAGGLVVDQAGHVVDMAAEGAGYVSESASDALEVLKKQGAALMDIAQKAVSLIDLSDQKNWETAKKIVTAAIKNANNSGLLGVKLDEKTVRIVTDVIFGTMMYTYQYSNGLITLSEYADSMSEIILKEGLPAGVGFIADLFIGSIPNSGDIAKEVTYYLISKAFENNTTEGTEPEGQAAGNPAAETEPEGQNVS